jgi:hypothetical protein
MQTPFIFGKLAEGDHFVNRTEELKKLTMNFTSGLNTMIISPRRWGKTSLVKRASAITETDNKQVRICHIDLFTVNSEQQFYEQLLTRVVKKSETKWQNWVKTASQYLQNLVPVITLGTDPMTDFSLKIEIRENNRSWEEILNIPEKIAAGKKIRFVICIDEFQKIAQFTDSLSFQQKLRSVWQQHKLVSYCLYGSKRHVINELFQNQSMPFYRFGDLLYLPRIDQSHWLTYIQESFEKQGRKISMETTARIIEKAGNQPYYVQQLAHQVFVNTEAEATKETILKAVDDIFLYNSIMYTRETENLSSLQIALLKALSNGERNLSAKEVIEKYQLGTPGNIQRIKKSLEAKEIIDFFGETPEFIDPFFELWCRREL